MLRASDLRISRLPFTATRTTPMSVTAMPRIWSGTARNPKNSTMPTRTRTGIEPWKIVRLTAVVWCAAA
jgi:hypothetical protein